MLPRALFLVQMPAECQADAFAEAKSPLKRCFRVKNWFDKGKLGMFPSFRKFEKDKTLGW